MTSTHIYDLNKHPCDYLEFDPQNSDVLNQEIAIGDLHANPIKLIHLLIAKGILSLSRQDYLTLVDLYQTFPSPEMLETYLQTEPSFIQKKLKIYDDLIEKLTLNLSPIKLILIGDETGDRGQNDYFMIKLLNQINRLRKDPHNNTAAKFDLEILASNHGFEFITRMLTKPATLQTQETFVSPCGSADALSLLLQYNILEPQHFADQFNDSDYLANLRLLSITKAKNQNHQEVVTVFSHAPINFRDIQVLAATFGVPYDSTSFENLQQTVNKINDAFITELQKLYTEDSSYAAKLALLQKINPAIWNVYQQFQQDSAFNCHDYFHPNFLMHWVHGHCMIDNIALARANNESHIDWKQVLNLPSNITSLDDILGKGLSPELMIAEATVFEHFEASSQLLPPLIVETKRPSQESQNESSKTSKKRSHSDIDDDDTKDQQVGSVNKQNLLLHFRKIHGMKGAYQLIPVKNSCIGKKHRSPNSQKPLVS